MQEFLQSRDWTASEGVLFRRKPKYWLFHNHNINNKITSPKTEIVSLMDAASCISWKNPDRNIPTQEYI